MKKNEEILPVIKKELPAETKEKIKISVRKKIVCNNESEENIVGTTKKRIKPLIVAAAIVAISAASVVSVNAATDGAIFTKVKMIVNGNETEKKAEIIDNEDGSFTLKFDVDETESSASIEFSDENLSETKK